MNKPLRRVSFGILVLLGLLLANLSYLQVVDAKRIDNLGTNPRSVNEQFDKKRGDILVDGKAVATSVETDGRLKYLRTYTDVNLYAHATGFDSSIFKQTAVERLENDWLNGDANGLLVGRVKDFFSNEKDPGGSVSLTLNPKAQKAAVQALGKRKGAVVAIDPSTGAILAMASYPTYDPNVLSTHDVTAMQKAYAALNADPDNPILDRTIRETYAPGSTFKLVTSAAALSSGRYQPDSSIPGPASLDLPNTSKDLPNDDGRQCTFGSDTTTLATALRRSCNSSFGAVGMNLGQDALREQAQKFGFGTSFEVSSTTVPSVFPEGLDAPATAQSAIGQRDVKVTPLQMAMVAAGIANRGVVMKPYLVQDRLGPDLSRLDQTSPSEFGQAVTAGVANQLTDMMVGVVEQGTGSNAKIPGVRVAGKTGTAQQGSGGKRPHAWFVSFAPAASDQDAKVAVAVVIEDGDDQREVSGNRLAAPVAKAVMQAVLQ